MDNDMVNCADCKNLKKNETNDLTFKREYSPEEFIQGKLTNKIWIIGINPKNDIYLPQTKDKLIDTFSDKKQIHKYFKGFKNVSQKLFDKIEANKVIHTDLVKCSSSRWPPESSKNKNKSIGTNISKKIIDTCKKNLEKQLKEHKPSLIICNGIPVSEVIKSIFPLDEKNQTSYNSEALGWNVSIVLSGYIGRLDNLSKRRLGNEIDAILGVLSLN